jgi:lysophospholipase L1-like esterase
MLSAIVAFAVLAPISPSDPNLLYVGRFDRSNPEMPSCEWPASEVRLRVRGQSLVAKFDDQNGCAWELVVDGQDKGPQPLQKGLNTIQLNLGEAGEHEVSLVRRTEAFMGPTGIVGFEVPAGQLLKARPRRHHIEVVGDSITCGYGDEGHDQHEKFKPETENAFASYSCVAARLVNADVSLVAWSGRTMWPENTMPSIYDLALPTNPQSAYDFKGPVPEVVVINLATNDFRDKAPDEAGWTAAYEAFVKRVRSHYPKAQIYAATGSMMYGDLLATLKTYLAKIQSDLNDPRFHRIDFDPQRMEDGLGADWHPNLKTHQIMGTKLAETLKHDLGW